MSQIFDVNMLDGDTRHDLCQSSICSAIRHCDTKVASKAHYIPHFPRHVITNVAFMYGLYRSDGDSAKFAYF